MIDTDLEISAPVNLAINYVPTRVRSAFALLLQIDARFEDILRNAREPMIAQIKLAWWREAFDQPPHLRPKGEPVLKALSDNQALVSANTLHALVAAWETLLGNEEWTQAVIERHTQLRAEAVFQTYAKWMDSEQDMLPAGRQWALDALRQAFPERVSQAVSVPAATLPRARALRPLSILAMSVRTMSGPRLVWHALTGF